MTASAPSVRDRLRGSAFVVVAWLVSRAIILGVMFIAAPRIAPPDGGTRPVPSWSTLAAWDGGWYRLIATDGYSYADDGAQHPVAFFPLFPLLLRLLAATGMRVEIAGTIVANAAFFGALLVLHRWISRRHSERVAQWTVASLCFCPLSLFGTVIYTEGLFLLLTAGALWAFSSRKYVVAAGLGGLATATRLNGLMLLPAFAFTAWKEKRGRAAYLTSVATLSGFVAWVGFCTWRFDEPLAFLDVQRTWRTHGLVDAQSFIRPLLYGITGGAAWGEGLIKPLMVFGGAWVLWRHRNEVTTAEAAFGVCCIALLLMTRTLMAADRYMFAIAPVHLGFALLLQRHPRAGVVAMVYSALMLAVYSWRFATGVWTA